MEENRRTIIDDQTWDQYEFHGMLDLGFSCKAGEGFPEYTFAVRQPIKAPLPDVINRGWKGHTSPVVAIQNGQFRRKPNKREMAEAEIKPDMPHAIKQWIDGLLQEWHHKNKAGVILLDTFTAYREPGERLSASEKFDRVVDKASVSQQEEMLEKLLAARAEREAAGVQ